MPQGVAPKIDGTLSSGEWGDPTLILEQEVGGNVVTPPSRVFLRVSGDALYSGFENTVDVAVPLRLGREWGQNDAVEAALKVLDRPGTPTVVLRGFTTGKVVPSSEAGMPESASARLGSAITYAARIVSSSLWTAEMRIPLVALGLEPGKPARLAANFTARKTAGPNWVQWRGTGGSTWLVENAGILSIMP